MWLQRKPLGKFSAEKKHPASDFLVHNAAVIKAIPNSKFTIFYHGFEGWKEPSIRKYFFGARGENFPALQPLRSAVGDLFWESNCEPLLRHKQYTQNSNPGLQVERAQASKATNQCRFFILRHMAMCSRVSSPIAVYIDTDVF